MIYREAAVHDHWNSGRLELSRYLIVPYTLLQPDQLWMNLQKLVEQCRNVFGTPKDIHNVDWSGRSRRAQVRVHPLSQGDAAGRVNGHNGKAGPLEVRRYRVTWPFGFTTQANDGNPPRASEQLGQPVSIRRHLARPPRASVDGR
jgi:hypothetical protein